MCVCVYIYIKPLKSEAIHETGLSGNVVTSFFPLIIFIYIYICMYVCMFTLPKANRHFHRVIHSADMEKPLLDENY